jgi:hypothetical protein
LPEPPPDSTACSWRPGCWGALHGLNTLLSRCSFMQNRELH